MAASPPIQSVEVTSVQVTEFLVSAQLTAITDIASVAVTYPTDIASIDVDVAIGATGPPGPPGAVGPPGPIGPQGPPGAVPEAPTDGANYARQNSAWNNIDAIFATIASLNNYVPKAGATMTGALILNADPTVPLGAATKQYVDGLSAVYQPLDPDLTSIAGYGGTGTWLYRSAANTWSPVTIGANLTFSGGTLSAASGGISDAPNDGNTYARKSAAWFRIDNDPFGYVLRTGDTMTGNLAIAPASGDSFLLLNKISGANAWLLGQQASKNRWTVAIGNSTTETGSNVGSDFEIKRYNDAGTLIDTPMNMWRNDGSTTWRAGKTLSYANPQFSLNKLASGQNNVIAGYTNLSARWAIVLGDINAESGSNAGSSFAISRYSDAGAFLDNPIFIARATGLASVIGDPTAALGIATKQYVDAKVITPPVPRCGRLSYVSSTALSFGPYNGNVIMINGVIYTIPTTGIAGLGNLASVFYNGTAGTNLPASPGTTGITYIYCFNNAGTLTADFSQTAYAVDASGGANTGNIIKSGDASRTLIGACWNATGAIIGASSACVVSWHNRSPRSNTAGFPNFSWANTGFTAATTGIAPIVMLSGEVLQIDFNTVAFNGTSGQYGILQVLDPAGTNLLQRTCQLVGAGNPNDFLATTPVSDAGRNFAVWVSSSTVSNTFTLANNTVTVTAWL